MIINFKYLPKCWNCNKVLILGNVAGNSSYFCSGRCRKEFEKKLNIIKGKLKEANDGK